MKGKLIIFSAPSGAGKTTIVKYLLSKNYNLEFSISATSRQPRVNETDGKDYYFIPLNDFKRKIENEEFLEWEEVYPDKFYGTLKSEVERIRNKGKNVVFDVDVVGGCNIKEYYGDDALSIFIQPPSVETLEKRLKARSTDNNEVIKTRVEKAKYELTFAPRFDKIIVNDKLEDAFAEAEKTLEEFLKK
ncbi:MAG: guanylate kinase [Prolixibacteraceae bacterium]|nr:guanylate kinase [Prolixibacteraceae bacterium]MBN2649387.1 guanylate kinase [Prolixibacteraceae bacterium]